MKKMDKNILDSDRIGRLWLNFTIPAFFALAVHTLYNAVDTVFIGRYVGADGIAGLALVFPIQMFSIGIGLMAGTGGASLISRMLGAEKVSKARLALGNSITITALLSLIVSIAGLANISWWCRILGASDNTLIYTSDYLHVILLGMIFMSSSMTLSTVIRAGGNARVPMIGMVVSAFINIALDWLFIGPMEMSVKGAAWATVISQILCTIYFLIYYFAGEPVLTLSRRKLIPAIKIIYRKAELTFRLRDLRPDWGITCEIFIIGFSILGMTLSGSVSAIVVNRTVASFGGDIAMAAYGIITKVMMFAIMPAIAAGQGLQPIIGFNYGARRFDRVLKSIKIGVVSTTVIGVIVFLYVYFNTEAVVKIFIEDKELIGLSSYAVKRVFTAMYLIGFINIGSTVFQSIGKSMAVQAFLSTVTRSVLFLLPAVMILPRFMGLDGVWWAFPISDFLTFVLVFGMLAPVWFEMKRMASAGRKKKAEEENSSSDEPVIEPAAAAARCR